MALYKFRAFYEEDENIFRDVEVKPSNSFFHIGHAVKQAYNLPEDVQINIYQSNDNWKKGKQLPMDNPYKKSGIELGMLQIGNYVDDPHQKFVIEFKGKHEFIFHIELISLMGNAVKSDEYPKLVKSVGPSPFKKDDLLKHLDKKGKHTEEYGVDGEDDDMDEMGNEGEEEENDENAEETDGEMGEESGSDEFDF